MARPKSATVDLKARMKEPLRAKLEVAAKARGVSLNAELVHRLEQSFRDEQTTYEAFGGKEEYETARVFALVANQIGARTGEPWTRNSETLRAVATAWLTVGGALARKEITGSDFLRDIPALGVGQRLVNQAKCAASKRKETASQPISSTTRSRKG